MILIETNLGAIKLELHTDKVPETCRNFTDYVQQGFYDNTIFHRVINDFMVQGGGFEAGMVQKETNAVIDNEADMASSNKRGTIAMARTSDPHSATAQFFINLRDNAFLDFKAKNPEGWGYCVFGQVVEGMDVVDKIAAVETTTRAGHQDVPTNPVIIQQVTLT